MDVLAAAGADLNIVNPERHTALILALVNGHFDVAGRLIDHGADLDMQDEVGCVGGGLLMSHNQGSVK